MGTSKNEALKKMKNPEINYINNAKIRFKFDGSCLKQDKLTFTPKAALKFYIVFEINV